MAHDYTVTLRTTNFEIKVSPTTLYGYFEHDRLGDQCGGGLWFGDCPDVRRRLELLDFDGTYELPAEVIGALRGAGYLVDDIFE